MTLVIKKRTIRIDNQAVVAILNKLTSKSEWVHIMTLLRTFVIAFMKYDILFRAVYLASKDNVVAYSISLKQLARLRQAGVPQSFHNISSLSLLSF